MDTRAHLCTQFSYVQKAMAPDASATNCSVASLSPTPLHRAVRRLADTCPVFYMMPQWTTYAPSRRWSRASKAGC